MAVVVIVIANVKAVTTTRAIQRCVVISVIIVSVVIQHTIDVIAVVVGDEVHERSCVNTVIVIITVADVTSKIFKCVVVAVVEVEWL